MNIVGHRTCFRQRLANFQVGLAKYAAPSQSTTSIDHTPTCNACSLKSASSIGQRSTVTTVCVAQRAYLWKYTSDLYQFFVRATYGRGLVLLWRHCDMLCTSGFTDDVILAHKPRQLNVAAQLMEAQTTCSLGLGSKRRVGIPVAGQWTHTHGPIFRTPRSGPTRPQWEC